MINQNSNYEEIKRMYGHVLDFPPSQGYKEPTAIYQGARLISLAIMALAEAQRPQPAVVNVEVTEAVVNKMREASK